MKIMLLPAGGCLVGGLSAFGQGFVSFANLGTGVDSPFKYIDGTLVSGSGFTVELLVGATPTSVTDSITPFFTGSFTAGYFNGGSRTVPAQDVFAWPASPISLAPNGTYAAVRVWSNLGGSVTSYAQALTTLGAVYGVTQVWEIPVQTSLTVPPAPMYGMPLMSPLGPTIPEPSTILLGALGVGAWLLRGRRRS